LGSDPLVDLGWGWLRLALGDGVSLRHGYIWHSGGAWCPGGGRDRGRGCGGNARNTGELRVDLHSVGHGGGRGSSRDKRSSAGRAGGSTCRRWSGGMESRGRDSSGSCSGVITGGLFPRPSPARPRPSSDGVEGGIGLSRVLARSAVLGFVLGPPEALEVLAIRGGSARRLHGRDGPEGRTASRSSWVDEKSHDVYPAWLEEVKGINARRAGQLTIDVQGRNSLMAAI
jgi:hypothetical protein